MMTVAVAASPGKFANASRQKSFSNACRVAALIACAVFLVGAFFWTIDWLAAHDIYHQHFFERGRQVATYNSCRIVFACFLSWIVYATGDAVASMLLPASSRRDFSALEHAVFGFATGIGIWQVVLLTLGLCNLYYPVVMAALCLVALAASSFQLERVIGNLVGGAKQLAHGQLQFKPLSFCGALAVGAALAWLLVVRGLYPGGASDYYTHYFQYYMQVIHNHGLAPNDVWYHYYYSKGAGLTFLGMLLTDPEAAQIATYCCVAFAALALYSLSTRLTRNSLWPVFCAGLYVLYNVVALLSMGAGEFQKTHEESTALVVMTVWAICMHRMEPMGWRKPALIVLTSLLIGAAILSESVVIFLAAYFGVSAAVSWKYKDFRDSRSQTILCLIASCAVGACWLLNYLVTGLATDQALDFTWRFANFERLNHWGVIENLLMVAWIRDNYKHEIVPWGWGTVQQLSEFMRVNLLMWPLVSGGGILFTYSLTRLIAFSSAATLTRHLKRSFRFLVEPKATTLRSICVLKSLVLFLTSSAFISLAFGRSQPISFLRFSSFFFPIMALLVTVSWSVFVNEFNLGRTANRAMRVGVPLILILVVLSSWNNWFVQCRQATSWAWQFMRGKYSLADAYGHQLVGYPFGGINPGTYFAAIHAPFGARIWSTNIDSYCMAPDRPIESVISYKLSSHLNEILNGSPEVARTILQREGLNYFIFCREFRIIDLLALSHLFHPDNIGRYLAIKWSDGNTYLLTWKGQGTAPIGDSFLTAYRQRLNAPEPQWFRFKEALPYVQAVMSHYEESPHPWKAMAFPWRHRQPDSSLPAQSCAPHSLVSALASNKDIDLVALWSNRCIRLVSGKR